MGRGGQVARRKGAHRLLTVFLPKGADAAVRPVPWLLPGAHRRLMELQLHGHAAHRRDGLGRGA